MSEVADRLEAFADAIGEGSLDDADRLLDEISELLSERESAERRRVERALAARDEADSPSGRRSFGTFASSHVGVEMQRAGFLTDAAVFLTDPKGVSAESTAATAEQLAETEREFEDATESIEPELDTINIGPRPAVATVDVDADPTKGTETSVTCQLLNAGDEASNTVSVSFDSTFNIDPERKTTTLKPDEQAAVTATFVPDTAGQASITVTVDHGDTTIDSRSVDFVVLDKSTAVTDGLDSIEQLRTRVKEFVDARQRRQQLLVSLDQAEESLKRATESLDREQENRASNMITRAINQLGAFVNKVESGKRNERGLSTEERHALKNAAEATIESLALGRRADT